MNDSASSVPMVILGIVLLALVTAVGMRIDADELSKLNIQL